MMKIAYAYLFIFIIKYSSYMLFNVLMKVCPEDPENRISKMLRNHLRC